MVSEAPAAGPLVFESALKPWHVVLGTFAFYFPAGLLVAFVVLVLDANSWGFTVLYAAVWALLISVSMRLLNGQVFVRRYEVWPDRVHIVRLLWSVDVPYRYVRGFDLPGAGPPSRFRRLLSPLFGFPADSGVTSIDPITRWWVPRWLWPKDPEAFVREANAAHAAWYRAL